MQSSSLDFMVYVIRTVRPKRIMIHDQDHLVPLPAFFPHPVNHRIRIQVEFTTLAYRNDPSQYLAAVPFYSFWYSCTIQNVSNRFMNTFKRSRGEFG